MGQCDAWANGPSTEAASRVSPAFVESNYDHVYWKSRGSHDITEDGKKIRIDYASMDKRPGQSTVEARSSDSKSHVPVNMNDGANDMGSTPNNVSWPALVRLQSRELIRLTCITSHQILLLRNLDPLTKEGDIARSLENLDPDTKQRVSDAKGPRRIVLIKDRDSNASWCFAFAFFPDEEVSLSTSTPEAYSRSELSMCACCSPRRLL